MLVALALGACSGQPASVDNKDPNTFLLTAARALVGRDLEVLADPVLRIEEGVMVEVSSGPAQPGNGTQVIDAGDVTLLPGFIDAHVHLGFHPSEEILAGGITTVRDLGAPTERIFQEVERSRTDSTIPRVLAAGPMLTVPGGYPTRATWAEPGTGSPVTTPEEASAAVAELHERGSSIIKVALNPPAGPTLDGATLGAIVDSAHRLGLKVTGHIYGLEQLDKALDAGVDELAHMLMSTEEIPDRTIARMVSSGMAVVPTLSIRSKRDLKVAIANLERFRLAGGRIVYGTDLGNEGPLPGIDPLEVKAMERAGYSSSEIIRSATIDAAAWLGLDDRGAIRVGAVADIIGVAGEPEVDVGALTEVSFVMRNGSVVREP